MSDPALAAGAQQPARAWLRAWPGLEAYLGAVGRLGLLVLFSVLVGFLAYQAPASGRVAVGWLGDRLFLDASAGLGADAEQRGDLYADALTTDSPTGRSRWTRGHARVVLPGLGTGSDLEVALLVQGWPSDVVGAEVDQPVVVVQADGSVLGTFIPNESWEVYTFQVPAEVRQGADLSLDLITSATFMDTVTFGADARPKGVRLADVRVRGSDDGAIRVLQPAWRVVGWLTLWGLLLYLVLRRLTGSVPPAFVAAVISVGVLGVCLALWRVWVGVALGALVGVALATLVLAWQRPLLYAGGQIVRRYGQSRSLGYGLVVAALAWLAYTLVRLEATYHLPERALMRQTFPDSLLYVLMGVGLLSLTLVLGRKGLPRLADGMVDRFRGRTGALAVLLGLGGIWLGYEALVVSRLPYVGHADYADNAVVARNLVAGRGWVVDYVTQFYTLYDGVTRPQETWPLLQPVWVAPFVALFGPQAWAVKLPNLIFMVILLLLVYHIGAYVWDRRVGVTAALLILTNHLFFRLAIYATSDLAFVVLALGAMYLLYRAIVEGGLQTGNHRRWWHLLWYNRMLVGSGVLTGLMMLQKPSGALIAVGMGCWLLWQVGPWTVEHHASSIGHRLSAIIQHPVFMTMGRVVALWAIPALLVLSPYVVRNLVLFGSPVYSTERYDAWVLGYRGDSEEAWEDIYRVYAPELGGSGLPEPNWILRWGFDQSLDKFWTQVEAARDYLLPAWSGAPAGLDDMLSADARRNVLAPLGTWLAFLGMGLALVYRRRLMVLLLLAAGLYTLFLMTYWRTNEWRYFVVVMPWMTLLAAWVLWAGFDRLAAVGQRRWSPLALVLVIASVVAIMQPAWPQIAEKVQAEPARWEPDLLAYDWLREHTAPDTVMMTRVPWQLNWHTERPAMMIPNTGDRDMLLRLAHHYDAEYLVLEHQLRAKGDVARILSPLIRDDVVVGDTIDGFTLVYISPTPGRRALIYRIPE